MYFWILHKTTNIYLYGSICASHHHHHHHHHHHIHPQIWLYWSSDRPQSIPLPYVCYRTSLETLQKEFGTSHRFILFAKQTSEITIKFSVWNTFHRISRILFCFIQRQLHKSTEISLALIFLISKLFGLLSGMKLKEFFLLQNSRGKRKTLKGSFDFCCRFGLSVLARNEPEAPIKRQHHTQFFFYIYSNSCSPHSKYKMDSLSHCK